MNDWIPIKEQIPPKKKLSLFCGVQGGIFLGFYVGNLGNFYGNFPTAATLGGGGSVHRTVTAWLPVPEPYVDTDKLAAYEEIRNAYHFRKKQGKE